MRGRAAPPYYQDHAGALGPHGLEPASFDAWLARADAARDRLRRAAVLPPPLALARRSDDLDGIAATARVLAARVTDVVVLGIGGSSLGAQALLALAPGGAPHVHMVETIDPWSWQRAVADLDPARTAFIAVSRSGSTPETVAQALLAVTLLRATVGEDRLAEHMLVLAGPGESPLRSLARRFGLTTLDHDPALSGRFSVLSNVGLLPATLGGIDGPELRAGARAVLDHALAAADARDAAPVVGAALQVGLARERGVATSVLLGYADALAPFGAWYTQLWAESLGKAGNGTQPVAARGPADQHSQLQLWLDGPADKLFTVVVLDRAATGPRLDAALAGDPAIGYLEGHTLGDLLEAEQRATIETLIRAGRPVRVLRAPTLDAAMLGALLMHMMIETILACDLLGVDPFDQPAVEQGKVLTRRWLARA
jgi:glucose-6-phosphate isomerase